MTASSPQSTAPLYESMHVDTAKILSALLMLLSSLLAGSLPIIINQLYKCLNSEHRSLRIVRRLCALTLSILPCALCFGGGVLLATVFLHIIPEIREEFDIYTKDWPDVGLSYLELFICIGFFLLYIVETIVETTLIKHSDHKHKDNGHNDRASDPEQYIGVQSSDKLANHEGDLEVGKFGTHVTNHLKHVHSLRVVIIVSSLSLHCVFEGLAIGFEQNTSGVWLLFTGILPHKLIVIFCVAHQMFIQKHGFYIINLAVSILSVTSPFGIILGYLVGRAIYTHILYALILQSLAAGTIIYVVFFEILAPEKEKSDSGMLKLFAVLFGFLLITGIQIMNGPHSHSHFPNDHHHDHHHGDLHHHDHHHGDLHHHDHHHGDLNHHDHHHGDLHHHDHHHGDLHHHDHHHHYHNISLSNQIEARLSHVVRFLNGNSIKDEAQALETYKELSISGIEDNNLINSLLMNISFDSLVHMTRNNCENGIISNHLDEMIAENIEYKNLSSKKLNTIFQLLDAVWCVTNKYLNNGPTLVHTSHESVATESEQSQSEKQTTKPTDTNTDEPTLETTTK